MSFINKFKVRDFWFALAAGLVAGTIYWRVLEYLAVPKFHGFSWASLVIIIPILWILGVLFGYFLGQWLKFFNQFGKFVAIGFTNFAVNLGTLDVLLALTGYANGFGYVIINSIAFIVATIASYFWNKFWTFDAGQSGGGGTEFGKFFIVTIISFGINVVVASSIVNFISPVLGMTAHQWADVGAICGSAAAIISNFIGFKLAVFRD